MAWPDRIPRRHNFSRRGPYYPRGGGGGEGGGTQIFSHIRRLGPFFGFKKMYIFLGYEDFVDIFWGSSQNWASLRVISMQFRVFF